jgi:hypothetical protein
MDSLLLNTNGTTNLIDIDDAKIYYTGGSRSCLIQPMYLHFQLLQASRLSFVDLVKQ